MVAKKITPKTKTVIKKATVEDLILGKEDKIEKITEYDYTNKNVKYVVTVAVNDRKLNACGAEIEFYIGASNAKARKDLIAGAKKVEIFNPVTNDLKYIIEVVE